MTELLRMPQIPILRTHTLQNNEDSHWETSLLGEIKDWWQNMMLHCHTFLNNTQRRVRTRVICKDKQRISLISRKQLTKWTYFQCWISKEKYKGYPFKIYRNRKKTWRATMVYRNFQVTISFPLFLLERENFFLKW